MQDALSSSQEAAKEVKSSRAEVEALTQQLEEQRKLTSQAEEALSASKVYNQQLSCTYLCSFLYLYVGSCPLKDALFVLPESITAAAIP